MVNQKGFPFACFPNMEKLPIRSIHSGGANEQTEASTFTKVLSEKGPKKEMSEGIEAYQNEHKICNFIIIAKEFPVVFATVLFFFIRLLDALDIEAYGSVCVAPSSSIFLK